MPLIKGIDEIYIITKKNKIKCNLYFETERRIGFLIQESNIEGIKSETRFDFEAKQNNYDCSFQSKIEYIEYDFVNNQYLLVVETPPVLRRVLKTYK
ncbi:MAG: hypothetical protein ACK4UJ_10685 [Leptonema sp. (in: bacteria)]